MIGNGLVANSSGTIGRINTSNGPKDKTAKCGKTAVQGGIHHESSTAWKSGGTSVAENNTRKRFAGAAASPNGTDSLANCPD